MIEARASLFFISKLFSFLLCFTNTLPTLFYTWIFVAELGDHDVDTHTEGYVSELRLAPQQSEDLEQAIQSSHQKLM